MNHFHEIKSLLDGGGWSSSYSFYYNCVYLFYNELKITIEKIKQKENDIKKQYINDELLQLLVYEGTKEERFNCFKNSCSIELFSCITIEGFVNYYGVRKFGESFYKEHIERLDIFKKIAIVTAINNKKLILNSSEILKRAKFLFDTRNMLVHPKTKEFNLKEIKETKNFVDVYADSKKCIENMEYIIKAFCSFDDELKEYFEFYFRLDTQN